MTPFDWRGNLRELLALWTLKVLLTSALVVGFTVYTESNEATQLRWDAAPAAPAHNTTHGGEAP